MRAGFHPTLPWLTQAQFFRRRSNRSAEAPSKGVRPGLARKGGPSYNRPRRTGARNSLETRLARDAGVLPHEIGHGWYVELFWPGAVQDRSGHYGGPGPDWLDETAAILMETEAFAADRRRQFEQIYRGTNSGPGIERHSPQS